MDQADKYAKNLAIKKGPPKGYVIDVLNLKNRSLSLTRSNSCCEPLEPFLKLVFADADAWNKYLVGQLPKRIATG